MKAGSSFKCLFLAMLYCVLYLVTAASDEDLVDFDFSDLKEIDWNYNDNEMLATTGDKQKHKNKNQNTFNDVTFDEEDDAIEENQVRPFDWRENILRVALSKALTNTALRQKFVEVMPILRVLSSQQRLALSALISAQINAKKGQELKLEQVRMMFGDDKKLLLPIVYDIANLVRSSARKYLQFDYDTPAAAKLKQTTIERRDFELSSAEAEADALTKDIGTTATRGHDDADAGDDDSLEDFLPNMEDDILDPQSINEELQAATPESKLTPMITETLDFAVKINDELQAGMIKLEEKPNLKPIAKTTTRTTAKTTTETTSTESTASVTTKTPFTPSTTTAETTKRHRRHAAVAPTDFVHKLIRSVPLSVNEDDSRKGTAGNTIKLNTTAFLTPIEQQQLIAATTDRITTTIVTSSGGNFDAVFPSALTYQEIEDLAFASLNGTEVQLNTAAAAVAADARQDDVDSQTNEEPLPNPEELIAGPRYRINGNKLHLTRPKVAEKRKRIQVRSRPKGSSTPLRQQQLQHQLPSQQQQQQYQQQLQPAASNTASKKCERFTASMCIRTDDYPLDQIMGSIRRHKNAMTALLAEYHDKGASMEFSEDFDDFSYNRREDDGATGGGMCQSIVRYARPQKARSASGEWKYIVNTGQHTQTLRLEKCTKPQESCSYLAHNYRSHCSQVYNYHRLLSWDKTRGLHVDIFKVPTCCSCQIDGYHQQFPPLASASIKSKDFTPVYNPAETYSTINEELDYNDEEDEDDLSYQFSNNYGHQLNSKNKKQDNNYDANELHAGGSKKIRTKVYSVNPTLGSYLIPPGNDEYERNHAYKQHSQSQQGGSSSSGATISSTVTSSKNSLNALTRRRPYKSLNAASVNEARVDLDLAQSETHTDKEVNNFFGITHATKDKTRVQNLQPQQKRKRIYSVPHTATISNSNIVSSTVAAISPQAAGAGTATRVFGFGGGSSTATNAYETPAASPSYYTPNSYSSVGKSKPRFRAAAAAAPSVPIATASPSTTEHAFTHYQPSSPSSSSAFPPSIYHVNSLYSAKYNASNSGGISPPIHSGSKRINYSYHPIIDFFENNKRSAGISTTTSSAASSTSSSPTSLSSDQQEDTSTELLYPLKIPKSSYIDVGVFRSRDRRIGYGAGGAGAGGGGRFSDEDNAWHPVVVQSERRQN